MNGAYDILLGGEPAGTAQVTREGLYYCFRCQVSLSGEVMYKLVLQKEDETLDLGIPAPQGDAFTLTTRIPVKRVGDGLFSIRAVPRHAPVGTAFVPLKEDEPFRYLSRLNEAAFDIVNGHPGVVLNEYTK